MVVAPILVELVNVEAKMIVCIWVLEKYSAELDSTVINKLTSTRIKQIKNNFPHIKQNKTKKKKK